MLRYKCVALFCLWGIGDNKVLYYSLYKLFLESIINGKINMKVCDD